MDSQPLIELGAKVVIAVSKEFGVVIGRAQYLYTEDQYLVRYQRSDGCAVEQWWGASVLDRTTA